MISVIRAVDQRVVPWKNGLGTTREVAVDPPDGDVARGFRWRVSLATIERGCPFSSFPGYDRQIVLVRGPGMTLVVDGREHELRRWSPVVPFAGEAAASCRLERRGEGMVEAPVIDLNLMVERAHGRGDLSVSTLDAESRLDAGMGVVVAITLAGRVEARGDRSTTFALEDLDALRVDGPDVFSLQPLGGPATVALLRVTPAA